MRTAPPSLLPLLRSQLQGNLLALTYLNPTSEYTLTEAARLIDASVKATQHEADRLVTAHILADRRQGNLRLIRAVTDSPLSRPLTDLLSVTYGPLPVLTDELRDVPGIGDAFVYGSWAARYAGEPGPPPNDVDVLIVGDADPDQLDDAARRAEQRLGNREVNIRRVRAHVWNDPSATDPFLTSVRSRPLVQLPVPAASEPGRAHDTDHAHRYREHT